MTRGFVSTRVWWLDACQLVRGGAVRTVLALWVVVGLLALWHGASVMHRQREVLAASDARQAEQHATVFKTAAPAAAGGDLLYYLFFHTRNHPQPWAGVAVGQRDVQSYNLRVRPLAIEGQLYDAELGNPWLAALGPLDVALVIVLLAPLLVLVLTHDLWSSEREQGTAVLASVQPVPLGRVMLAKLCIRLAVALAPPLTLLALAMVALRLPLNGSAAVVAAAVTAYVLFWGALGAAIGIVGRSSAFNLILGLSAWMLLAVAGPAAVSTLSAWKYPAPAGLELTLQQRAGYHGGWDRPLNETMAAFYRHYPEWQHTPVPTTVYSNAWYYAMQQRGDDMAATAASEYERALRQREAWVQRTGWWLPPVAMQTVFTAAAATDVGSHLDYLASVRRFHDAVERFFLPAIFLNTPWRDVRWADVPRHDFQAPVGGTRARVAASALAVQLLVALAVTWMAARRVTPE